jgi:hypothetical protein
MELVTHSELRMLGDMPPNLVDTVESKFPGIVAGKIAAVSGIFNTKLAKRYAAAFTMPYPDALKMQVACVVAFRLWIVLGYNPEGALDQHLKALHDAALAWLDSAANGETGLIELPGSEDPMASAVDKGGTLAYTETSPYVWADVQSDRGRDEDRSGEGT